jgi:hypothetical protein
VYIAAGLEPPTFGSRVQSTLGVGGAGLAVAAGGLEPPTFGSRVQSTLGVAEPVLQ